MRKTLEKFELVWVVTKSQATKKILVRDFISLRCSNVKKCIFYDRAGQRVPLIFALAIT